MIDPTSGGFTRGPGVSPYGRGPRRANWHGAFLLFSPVVRAVLHTDSPPSPSGFPSSP